MSIKLSPQHGVRCFFCLEAKNEVILAGRLKGAAEAPKDRVWDKEPCDACKEWMEQGIILIVANQTTGERHGFHVVTHNALDRCIKPPELLEDIKRKRYVFLEPDVWAVLNPED